MDTFNHIIKPAVTEKSTELEKKGKYAFYVRNDANKIAIKTAFKKLYGIDVVKVNVMNTAEKFKMSGSRRPVVKKAGYKKVIITTKGKKSVDLTKPTAKA